LESGIWNPSTIFSIEELPWIEKMAEEEGFEPPVSYPTTVFKTAAFDHSATPPQIQRVSMARWI
jgi:hypothetical protein